MVSARLRGRIVVTLDRGGKLRGGEVAGEVIATGSDCVRVVGVFVVRGLSLDR